MADVKTRILFLAAVLVGFLVLGAGALYAYLVITGDQRDIPPSVTLVLGLAIGQIGNLVLGQLAHQQANGISDRLNNANNKQDAVQIRQEEILRQIALMKSEQNRQGSEQSRQGSEQTRQGSEQTRQADTQRNVKPEELP